MELFVLHRDVARRQALVRMMDGQPVGAYRAAAREVAGWTALRSGLEKAGVASAALVELDLGSRSGEEDEFPSMLHDLVAAFPTTVFLALVKPAPSSAGRVVALESEGVSAVAVGHHDTASSLARALSRGLVGKYRAALAALGLEAVPGRGSAILGAAGTAAVVGAGVDRMARELGVSAPTLTRWCRAAGLPPPGQLLAWGRVLMAAALLDDSGRSVAGVAAAVGYAADSGLRRIFAQFLGSSPAALRARGAFEAAGHAFRTALEAESVPRRAIDPGDLRSLPPSRTLSIGPPSPAVVLDEMPGEAALRLWLLLTDLQLAGVRVLQPDPGPRRRGPALAGETLDDPELHAPLEVLDRALERPAPLHRDAGVREAATEVVRILRMRGLHASAAAVAATAVWLQPAVHETNLLAGSALAERGRFEEAESLLARAVIIARQGGAWPAYCDAGLALAAIHRKRGELDPARRMLARIRSRAGRHGLGPRLAEASHALFALERAAGNVEQADRIAREVIGRLGPDDQAATPLRTAVGRAWLDDGRADRAMPLLVLAADGDPGASVADRGLAAALACRAAAECRSRELFERWWAEAWRWSYEVNEECRAGLLCELVRAAGAMGEETRARLAVQRGAGSGNESGGGI